MTQLIPVEDDGVEVELGERLARLLLELGARINARAPDVIHAGRVVRDVSAAVRGDDLQLRKALEDAVEDEVRDRDRGIERVADDVVEVMIRQTFRAREAVRVHEHHDP